VDAWPVDFFNISRLSDYFLMGCISNSLENDHVTKVTRVMYLDAFFGITEAMENGYDTWNWGKPVTENSSKRTGKM
jgi:hypothetical protein